MFRKRKRKPFKKRLIGVYHHLHDHIIPNHRNNHRPHALRHHVLAGYSVLLVLLKVFAVTAAVVVPAASVYSSAITRANIISLTNQTRIGLGLPTLVENGLLNAAAQNKATDMLADQYFAHTSPDGVTPWNFINNAGYYYQYAGENLAVHYTSAEGVVSGWMASPTHRANIVDERFSDIGVGIAEGVFEDYDTTFVVQMFGLLPGVVAEEAGIEDEGADAAITQEEPAEPVEPAPEPAEAPTESVDIAPSAEEPLPEPTPEPDEPIVTSAAIIPIENGYDVTVQAENSKKVAVNVGETTTLLTQNPETDKWEGTVLTGMPVEEEPASEVSVTMTNVKGETSTKAVAWIGASDPAELFAFGNNQEPYKLFGFIPIKNIDDNVNAFYISFIVALALLLAVSILVKVEIQHRATVAHGLFVIIGAVILILV